ncbi:MAG TPA: hypothetical protein VKB03_10455 [Conexibacter sp.]|nr:hypothetical protein [Conexibacter sp.]
MNQVSRPVQVLLAVTVLLAALWFVALRPKSSAGGESPSAPAPAAQPTPPSSGGSAPGTEGLKSAIDKAHGAVATANGDAARAEQSSADGSAPARVSAGAPAASAAKGANPHAARGAAAHHPPASSQVRAVKAALRHHKAVVIAFVDPHTADARAVAHEVRSVSHFDGRAVTLAVPLAKLSSYDFITNRVEITVAPTVVIVDPRRRATTIVGFTDRGEIEQRLADALTVKRR